MNSKREILDILRDDATTNEQTIAAMLGIGEDEVAAVRAAGGHIFFPVERHRSIAAPSADDGDAHFIHEHSCTSS